MKHRTLRFLCLTLALATLAVPDSGFVLMDGQDALARPLKYCRQVGYLPENVALYPDMTEEQAQLVIDTVIKIDETNDQKRIKSEEQV
mgnify:CR=1 FL=1